MCLVEKQNYRENKKPSKAMLKLDKVKKVRYNHPQLVGTHKAPKSS